MCDELGFKLVDFIDVKSPIASTTATTATVTGSAEGTSSTSSACTPTEDDMHELFTNLAIIAGGCEGNDTCCLDLDKVHDRLKYALYTADSVLGSFKEIINEAKKTANRSKKNKQIKVDAVAKLEHIIKTKPYLIEDYIQKKCVSQLIHHQVRRRKTTTTTKPTKKKKNKNKSSTSTIKKKPKKRNRHSRRKRSVSRTMVLV